MEPTEIDLEDLSNDELIYIASQLSEDVENLETLNQEEIVDLLRRQNVNPVDYFQPNELSNFGAEPESFFLEYEPRLYDNLFGAEAVDPKSFLKSISKAIIELVNYPCDKDIPISTLYLLSEYTKPLILNIITKESEFCVDNPIKIAVTITSEQIIAEYMEEPEAIIGKSRCRDQRYQIIPVRSVHDHQEKEEPYEVGHFTVLIVDHENKEIEYFEPNGEGAEWYSYIETLLANELVEKYPEYNFIPTSEICTKTIQSGPLCVMYTLLYIWLRVKEPGRDRNKVANSMLLVKRKGTTYLIYKLMCLFYDLIQKYHLQNIQDRYNKIKSLIEEHMLEIDIDKLKQIDDLYFNLDLEGLRKVYFEFLKLKGKTQQGNISGFNLTDNYNLISKIDEMKI